MLKREDYKAIKHMTKDQLECYLEHIFQEGYEAGVRAVANEMKDWAAVSASEDRT